MLRITLLLTCSFALFVAGCKGSGGSGDASAAAWAELTEGKWILESLAGDPPLADHEISMRVGSDGGVDGVASVNRFSAGGVASSTGGWTLDLATTTRMAGPAEAMDQEQLFLRLLQRANGWRIHKRVLELTEGSRSLMRFQRPSPDEQASQE